MKINPQYLSELQLNFKPSIYSRRTRRDISANRILRSHYNYDLANRLNFVANKTIGKQDEPSQEIPMPMGRFFDNLKRVLTVIPAFAAESLEVKSISSFNYTYDDVGNRLDKVTVRQEQTQETYGYDDTYQLISVSGDQAHSYDYDAVGNREVVDATSYTANNLNQYTDVGGSTYSYDNNGNLENDGTNSYIYDFENRLETAIGGQNSSYEYDGFGRRISKTVDAVTTYYIYDGDQVIEERDYSGTLAARYTYGTGIDEVLLMRRDSQNYYYFADGLGSVSELVTANGAVAESYSYDVYGTPSQTSSIGNRFMFTGREFDEESELYYYRARMYSPAIGRFLQRDPVGYYDSLNLYSYVNNNPVNFLDPYGLYSYETTNFALAFLHESNPFNPDSAMRQQMGSWGRFYTGDWAGAAAISGQSIVERTNRCGKASRWQIGYNAAQITAAVAAITAGTLIGLEALGISNIGAANVGWKGGEITLTRPGAQTPDWRFNPFGHYHRRPGIGQHRPWEGGW